MPIFHDENGLAIKFFIQKDIPHDIQTEVCETIAAHGGRVESKVPRAGFILVQPGTPEEERLRLCWNSPDRPERYFVPYTFVEACKVQGILLKQIFIQEGQPIRMHIDSSIANVNVRAALSQRIVVSVQRVAIEPTMHDLTIHWRLQHSGGDPTASAQSARVILADPNTEVFQHLVKTYQNESDKYVESYLWVKRCVEKGAVSYTPVVYKNPGGRRAGEERTHFTEEDEVHLCNWIAAKIPFKETGGRTGNRLYQQLCDMSGDPDYAWVSRHTWQSWRERYKKNAARLDTKITEIVERNKPSLGEKGQYGYVRKPEEKAKRIKRKGREGEAGPSTEEMDFVTQPIVAPPIPGPSAGPTSITSPPVIFSQLVYDPALGGAPPHFPPPPPAHIPPPDVIAAREHAAEEEDDEGEWRIREGHGTQPRWATKAEEEEEPPKKKQRTSSEAAIAEGSALHIVDQAVLDVAREFRFTFDEVKEYYDRCGDVNRTRNRFKIMRELLLLLPDDPSVVVSTSVLQQITAAPPAPAAVVQEISAQVTEPAQIDNNSQSTPAVLTA